MATPLACQHLLPPFPGLPVPPVRLPQPSGATDARPHLLRPKQGVAKNAGPFHS